MSSDSSSSSSGTANPDKPDFKIIFPTQDEIRASLDGYASGASLHMTTQSPQPRKQLEYMRPMLCHWANDTAKGVCEFCFCLTTHTLPSPTFLARLKCRARMGGAIFMI